MPQGLEFDGEKYKSASRHQKEWGGKIVSELALPTNARVLDLGCGDGVLTEQLARLVPEGLALGIDASQSMIDTAKKLERNNLHFQRLDINQMDFGDEFDLIFSNATLHWIKDHQGLLRKVYKALKANGTIRSNFAGDGNCSHFYKVIKEVMAEPRYAPNFKDFIWPWFMPWVEEYAQLVGAEAFVEVKVWGENADRYFANAEEMTGWIEQPSIVPFLRCVAAEDAKPFRDEVVEKMIALTRQADGRCFETFRRIKVFAKKPDYTKLHSIEQ